MRRLRPTDGRVTALAWLADGRLLTGDDAGTVTAWAADGSPRRLLRARGDPHHLGWLAAAGGTVLARGPGAVRLYDTTGGRPRRLAAFGLRGRGAALAADGRSVAAYARPWVGPPRLAVYDAATLAERVVARPAGAARSLALSADGALLAAHVAPGDLSGDVVVWRTAGGPPVARVPGQAPPAAMAFLADGRLAWLAGGAASFAGPDGWHPAAVRRYPRPGVWAFAVAPGGALAATAGTGPILELWDADTGRVRAALDTGLAVVSAVAFAPDGLTVAAAGYREVVVFDVG